MDTLKHLGRHYGAQAIVKVEVPEIQVDGKPLIVRFRPRMTVGEVEALAEANTSTNDLVCLALFKLLAVDAHGENLITAETHDGFRDGMDAKFMVEIVDRANLVEIAFSALPVPKAEDVEEGKP